MPEILVPTNTGKLITMAEVNDICDEVRRGKPRRYMETFLKIEDENYKLIPLKFIENQEYFYENTFGVDGNFKKGFWAYVLKDRKARSSTFWGACLFAFLMNVPNYHAVIIGAQDQHAAVPLKMIDTFYDNLPDTVNPDTGIPILKNVQTHWDQSFREIGFGPNILENGKWHTDVKGKSSVKISTSKTSSAGRGGTPNFLWEIEKSEFDQTFETGLMTSMLNSPPKNFIRITDSTPKGTKNGHYTDFKSVSTKKVNAVYLVRYWYLNKVNQLTIDDRLTLPEDVREIEKTGTLAYTTEEKELMALFPQDGVPALNRILWRRSEMQKAIDIAKGDNSFGRAPFLQEHMENDVDCWNNMTNPAFDVMMLRRMIDSAREPLPDAKLREYNLSHMPIPGMKFRAWEVPYMGGRYYGGMDMAKGNQYGDDSVLEVFDAVHGRFVAEMFGKAALLRSVRAGAEVMRVYNVGVFGPERNSIGEGAVEALEEYGYPNTYHRQSNKPVRIDTVTPREYGWFTTPHNRPVMFGKFQEAIASGQLDIPNKELVEAINQWNPDPKSDEHAADRVMAAMIAYMLSLEGARFANVNAKMPEGARGMQQIRVVAGRPISPWLG